MTSVEWLFKQLWETPKDKLDWNAILEKAEEKHKKEIIEAFIGHDSDTDENTEIAEDYYNEVFKSEGVSEGVKPLYVKEFDIKVGTLKIDNSSPKIFPE